MSTFTATPQQVERVIAAVMPHASDDGHLPMITCVRVEILGPNFIAAATDRYTLGVTWAPLSDWDDDAEPVEPVEASIYAADWRRLFAFLKPHKRTRAEWTLSDEALTVTVAGRESLSVRTVDVDFPKWRAILGAQLEKRAANPDGSSTLNFNPRKIESFTASAKVLGATPGSLTLLVGALPTDPTVVRIGDDFVGLLMAVRVDDRPALDLSSIGIETVAPQAVAA